MFSLERIVAGYGETTVLWDVSLVVPPRSVVALLGPNGAGKTTLLRVASGLLKPTSGRVVVDGTELTGRRPFRFAGAGVCHVPEGRGIFPSLTVRENLLLQATGDPAEALDKAVGVFPVLGRRLLQLAGTMSGGEQQMLALARAYVTEARVILLDEVSMGLAPRVVDQIFDFLARLARDGTSLLLVEQYVSRALELANYVVVMNRGRLAFAGEPAEIDEEELFARYLGAHFSA
ncbi:MAG: branched-chain amino acid transport system ATP-binding protein [Actinomycetota bacterium]|jgi:branched-chain amino acid transport system ATP-binding protein|nr:branched-chain amino acid transport system ATP-binding protein [Actinomycetota bacterium]